MDGRADFGQRFLAAIIDGILLAVVGGLLGTLLGTTTSRGFSVLLGFAYYGWFEGGPSGQTVGKRAVGIRVIDAATSEPIGVSRALLRHLARFLSGIVLLLGYLWMLWDKERQTWHDKLASTYVVTTTAYPVDRWP